MRFQTRVCRRAKREQRRILRADRRCRHGGPYPFEIRLRMLQQATEDVALKEAIRRSLLEEEAKKNVENNSAAAASQTHPAENDALKSSQESGNAVKKDAPESAQEPDNVAKVVDAIGMTVGQCALIVGAVVNDIIESRRKANEAVSVAAASREPIDAIMLTKSPSNEVLGMGGKEPDGTISLCNVPESIAEQASQLSSERMKELQDPEAKISLVEDEENPEAKISFVEDEEKGLPHLASEETEKCQERVENIVGGSPEDEWDVVDSGRDVLAAIGSALYREDLSRSAEELSSRNFDAEKSPEVKKVDSDISWVSSVSSVETLDSEESDNISCPEAPLSAVVLARWDEELKQLRQLGFSDDRKSLEALETLEAAELGVDSDVAVSVNEAANWLLNHAE